MPKRKRDQCAPEPKDGLSAHTFTCSTSGLVVMLFFSGDKYCFYGTAKIQCLAGEFYVDDCKMPSGENIDFDSMRHVCAPYRLSRPAVLRTVPGNEDAPKYKLARLKYRLKEITPHFERIMEVIGEKYPAVVLVDRKPSQTVHVLDQVLQDFFVPSWLRPSCQFDRTVYFTADFDLYTDNSLYSLRGAMKDVNNQRAEGKRVVVVPVGSCGSGKSSLVRYLVNTNFKRDGPEIYLLDADVGQSEFTPAGCMSLWKIADVVLDVPCTHQAQVFPCSYFFGNISPADDTDKYREIFDQLMNDFHAASEPGALLIVNTLGWIEGLGLELLRHIFDVSRPALAISLSHDRGCSLVPRWVPLRIEVSTRFAPSCHHLKVPEEYSYPSRLVAYQLRDLAMVSYFSPVLPRPVLSSICDTTPYCVKFERITICVPEDYSYVDDRHFLATLNVQIVALCSTARDQPLETRRMLKNKSLPSISCITPSTPLLKCHGYGLIRAIDVDKKLFYVITPASTSTLSKVTIFARGTDMLVPQFMLESQPADNVLYLSRPALASKSGIISDLYGGLKNVKAQKREYFPANA